MFRIEIHKLYWINDTVDDPNDLCLHGDVTVVIGDEIYNESCTVSSTALYMLKSLSSNHIINENNQMLPCCGHTLIPNDDFDTVLISGCRNGVDWSVVHEGTKVKIITSTGKTTYIDFNEYKMIVFRFVDDIEAFYLQCSQKSMSSEFIPGCYKAFWNEWHRRRNV